MKLNPPLIAMSGTRRRPPGALVALAGALFAGCSTAPADNELEMHPQQPLITAAAETDVAAAAASADGLADAFATFTQVFTGSGFDARFPIGYGFHPGLVTEKIGVGGPIQGSATLNFVDNRVAASLSNVPSGGTFDLWFVKNIAGGGRTVKPEVGDKFLKVGRFRGTGAQRSLDILMGASIDFDLDMVVVTRGGKDPSESRLAVGSRTLFEKRFFRARLKKSLDPVTGTVAKDIESTDPLVGRGAELFFNETFGGNGRTCGTCHRADDSLTIDAAFIAKLPKTDPLFVAETNPALAKLENPQLMRERGLILENVDGFEDPTKKFVMRGVPHTLGLGLTNGIENAFSGPPDHRLGWSGDGAPGRGTLNEFAFGAVMQHFTKNLARRPGTDFRVPTQEELDALEAFQLFTGQQKPRDFSNQRPTDPKAHTGADLFFSSNCTFCHIDLFGSTFNTNFNTGVANVAKDLPLDDGFRGTGDFNIPPLAEAADTAPLFHNNSAATIEDAVAFYVSPTFQASPFGFLNFDFGVQEQAQIGAFLRVVNASENIRQVRKRAAFVKRTRSIGNTALLAVAIADTRDALRVLSAKKLNPAVQKQLKDVESTLVKAQADADANRPTAMTHAIAVLDKAEGALFDPNGGVGGMGGGADGGPDGTGGVGGGSDGGGGSGGGGMTAGDAGASSTGGSTDGK
jgi:hypothetical protein